MGVAEPPSELEIQNSAEKSPPKLNSGTNSGRNVNNNISNISDIMSQLSQSRRRESKGGLGRGDCELQPTFTDETNLKMRK